MSLPPTADEPSSRPIRLVVQQPSLAKYRVPVFRELARRPGIQLKVAYSTALNLTNVEPDGFDAEHVSMRRVRVGGEPFYWHGPQFTYATRRRADVLMVNWDVHYLSMVPGLLRARAAGVPTILWGHGYSKHERPWRRWARQSVARLATALVFYNRATAAAYVREGWDPRRVFVALNALDQAPIRAAREDWLARPGDLAAFRREHRLDDGGPTTLFVSRLDADNRVDLLLRAAARLRGRYPRLNVVVVGKGPDQPNLERLAAELGLADRAHFTGAIYDEHRLAPWFLSADVFCYPTNIGLSILHAFGYGLPVVTDAATEAQNPEIEALRDGENGLLYPHGDADALAAALDGLFSDPDRLRRMGRDALRTATEEFTLARMVDGFEAAARYCAAVAGITPPAGERGTPFFS